MNNEDYLNQISTSVRPASSAGGGLLSSKYFKIGAISIIALVLIMVVGSMLGSGKNTVRDRAYELKFRIDNTMSVISTYQPRVKSSALRSSSASLYGALSNTSKELDTYLTEKYNLKEKEIDKQMIEDTTAEKESLESELFEARINGVLDRIYAHKMAYEISVIYSKESTILGSAKDDSLKVLLDKSMTSLDNLYNNFNDFTEGNK